MTPMIPGKQSVRPGYLEVLLIALAVTCIALFASGEITEAQWQQGLDRLEQVFREQPPNRTILLKEVVLKNGREPELRIP